MSRRKHSRSQAAKGEIASDVKKKINVISERKKRSGLTSASKIDRDTRGQSSGKSYSTDIPHACLIINVKCEHYAFNPKYNCESISTYGERYALGEYEDI